MSTKQNKDISGYNENEPKKATENHSPEQRPKSNAVKIQEKIDEKTKVLMKQLSGLKESNCDKSNENSAVSGDDLIDKIDAQGKIIETKKQKIAEEERTRSADNKRHSSNVDTLSEQILRLTKERDRLFDENNHQKAVIADLRNSNNSRELLLPVFGKGNLDKKQQLTNPKAAKLNELLGIVAKIKCSYNDLMIAQEIQ